MQPSSKSGNRARLLLLPLSWVITFFIITFVLWLVANFQGYSVKELLKLEKGYWLFIIFISSFLFGKIIGLISINLLAYISPLKNIFEDESKKTGRHSFSKAMAGLIRAALIMLLILILVIVMYMILNQ